MSEPKRGWRCTGCARVVYQDPMPDEPYSFEHKHEWVRDPELPAPAPSPAPTLTRYNIAAGMAVPEPNGFFVLWTDVDAHLHARDQALRALVDSIAPVFLQLIERRIFSKGWLHWPPGPLHGQVFDKEQCAKDVQQLADTLTEPLTRLLDGPEAQP